MASSGAEGGEDERAAVAADQEAWAEILEAARVARAKPGITAQSAERFKRIASLAKITSGAVPPSRRRARARRLKRWARKTVALVVVMLAAAGAWTIAGPPPPRTSIWHPTFDPLLAEARVRDPQKSTSWGMRVFTSSGGQRCIKLGRLLEGRIGRRAEGQFVELPAGASASCLAAGHKTLVVVNKYGATTGRRTIVIGIAARGVRIGIGRRPPGRPVPIADDGTFIYVAVGVDALNGLSAFEIDARGRVTPHPLSVG